MKNISVLIRIQILQEGIYIFTSEHAYCGDHFWTNLKTEQTKSGCIILLYDGNIQYQSTVWKNHFPELYLFLNIWNVGIWSRASPFFIL